MGVDKSLHLGLSPGGTHFFLQPRGGQLCPLKTFPGQRVRQGQEPSPHAKPRDGQEAEAPVLLLALASDLYLRLFLEARSSQQLLLLISASSLRGPILGTPGPRRPDPDPTPVHLTSQIGMYTLLALPSSQLYSHSRHLRGPG